MSGTTTLRLSWRRQYMAAAPCDRWYVYGPWPSEACGGVWRERGCWRAEVWPLGRRILGAYYRNPRKAKLHIERWLRAHPQVVSPAYDPRGFKGRIQRRPDHLLEQAVRESRSTVGGL